MTKQRKVRLQRWLNLQQTKKSSNLIDFLCTSVHRQNQRRHNRSADICTLLRSSVRFGCWLIGRCLLLWTLQLIKAAVPTVASDGFWGWPFLWLQQQAHSPPADILCAAAGSITSLTSGLMRLHWPESLRRDTYFWIFYSFMCSWKKNETFKIWWTLSGAESESLLPTSLFFLTYRSADALEGIQDVCLS